MEELENIASPVIVILSESAFLTAKKIRSRFPHATIYSLAGRIPENKNEYTSFSDFIQKKYKEGIPIIALCAVGIIVRSLAPLLGILEISSPVIAVSGDGSSIIPILGVTEGANDLARKLGDILHCSPAITTTGELCFGVNLLRPPRDLFLVNPGNGKSFVSALLNGKTVRIEGDHAWFRDSFLPVSSNSNLVIRILPHTDKPVTIKKNELVYLRKPLTAGHVSLVGLGPGIQKFRTFSAQQALDKADDILGYEFYVDLAGPFLKNQTIYKSDNRRETERARHAFELAAQGRNVAIVSSGDPGIYAMAATILEVWEQDKEGIFDDIRLVIEPGISAAFSASACFGAPLGHDFSVISLSDNLKSWEIIEKRIRFSSKADMVMALYNPVSRTRKKQIYKVIRILQEERLPDTIIALAHDIAREGETLKITTLRNLQPDDITSRTVILVGSSRTRSFRKNSRDWIYTPRNYNTV